MLLYTSNYLYGGPDRLDISLIGRDKIGKIFNPMSGAEKDFKDEKINFDEYILLYKELMEQSYKKYNNIWINLLNRSQLVLVCSCKCHENCHRILLAKIFVDKGINVVYKGETK